MSETSETSVGKEFTGGMVLELDPSEILLPDETNVRPWSSQHKSDKAIEKMSRLAETIAEEGQLQPVLVMKNEDGKLPPYILIAGRRRVAAIKMHNLSADKPLKVKAVIAGIKDDKRKEQHMYRQAAFENTQRENLNAMDFAMNIAVTREKFGSAGKGGKGTAKLAEFFKVSPATITQHEKLLTLPDDLQEKVGAGELSNDAAFALAAVPEEKRAEVLIVAKGKQDAERMVSEQNTGDMLDVPVTDGVTVTVDTEPKPKKKKARAAKGGGIKAKHVKAAAREVTAAVVKRSRSELVEFFNGQLGPTNGHPNGSIHMFCEGFMMWADGRMGDKKLNNLWDEMVRKADRGTAQVKLAQPNVESKKGKTGVAGKPGKKKGARPKK